jgi:hypothetical protein
MSLEGLPRNLKEGELASQTRKPGLTAAVVVIHSAV